MDIKNLEKLEANIGYTFKNKNLLSTALTHSSYTNEAKAKGIITESNERLEFLGDSVLSLITSHHIFSVYPDVTEGELSKIRSCVVDSASLMEYSKSIGVGKYLLLGNGELQNGGRNKKSTLENVFEAIVAAIYLDGGYEFAKSFALPYIIERLKQADFEHDNTDYKTKLQILIQQGGKDEHFEYVTVLEYGPDHDKTFEVEARLNSNVIGRGKGHSKKFAEKQAAKDALKLFGINK